MVSHFEHARRPAQVDFSNRSLHLFLARHHDHTENYQETPQFLNNLRDLDALSRRASCSPGIETSRRASTIAIPRIRRQPRLDTPKTALDTLKINGLREIGFVVRRDKTGMMSRMKES